MKTFLTGVGSLPFKDESQAWDFSFQFDIPFRVELPHLYPKQSFLQRSKNQGNLTQRPFPLDRSIPLGIEIALHYPGPDVEANLNNNWSYEKYFSHLESEIVFDLQQWKNYARKKHLFFDMPLILDFSKKYPQSFDNFLNFLKELKTRYANIFLGIHCCNKIDWLLFSQIHLDFFSFDLQLFPLQEATLLLEMIPQLNLVLGVVDYQGISYPDENILGWAKLLKSCGKNEIFLSPTCGLAYSKNPDLVWKELLRIKAIIKKI